MKGPCMLVIQDQPFRLSICPRAKHRRCRRITMLWASGRYMLMAERGEIRIRRRALYLAQKLAPDGIKISRRVCGCCGWIWVSSFSSICSIRIFRVCILLGKPRNPVASRKSSLISNIPPNNTSPAPPPKSLTQPKPESTSSPLQANTSFASLPTSSSVVSNSPAKTTGNYGFSAVEA